MNHTNQVKQITQAKPDTDNKSRSNLPKLTVTQIIEKFVTPSTHRKFVQLSEPNTKSNKK